MKTRKKTNAKRIGIKSTVAYGDGKYAITTFGKGAETEIALTSADPPEETLPAQSAPGLSIHADFYEAKPEPESDPDFIDKTRISARRSQLESLISNPLESPRDDYLGLKDVIERKFFGREYPNDTIRIQIANAILDIQKILGIYVADVLHFVDSLQDEPTDLVGLRLGDEKMKKLLASASPYLGFFGGSEVFEIPGGKNKISPKEADEHNAKVFRALGAIRQKIAHFNWEQSLVIFGANATMPSQFFFDADAKNQKEKNRNQSLWPDVIAFLWRKRLENVRKKFCEKSAAMNLMVLNQIYGDDTEEKKKKRALQYYDFSVLKKGKNLGFNLTKTREAIIDAFKEFEIFHTSDLEKKRTIDTFRSKLYALLDFVLFDAASSNSSDKMGQTSIWRFAIDDALAQLREAPDDDAKEAIYKKLALKIDGTPLKRRLGDIFKKFLSDSKTPSFPMDLTKKKAIPPVNPEWLEETREADASSFVQLIAFLCNFLEGKEINELVTAFIRKFEGIQSLINLLRKLEGDDAVTFTDTFALFNEEQGEMAGKIADDLRLLASVGKMKPDMTPAKRVLYKNALAILGVEDEEMTDEWLAENILLDKSREDYNEKKKDVNPFRNYIAKNVITSRTFYYLVRYAKPTSVRKLMSNPKIIRYVLKRLPGKQVNSYYNALRPSVGEQKEKEGEKVDRKTLLDFLTKELTDFSFELLVNDKDKIIETSRDRKLNIEVERLKKLTSLYMSIAYIAVKNLVKVNARYFVAYSALERDLALFVEKYGDEITRHFIGYMRKTDKGEKEDQFRYLALLQYYLKRDAETLKRKCEICAEISRLNAEYKKSERHTADEERQWREKKKELNQERKRCEKKLHFSVRWKMDAKNREQAKSKHPQKWYDILNDHVAELFALQRTGSIATQARNDVEHLNTVNQFAAYISDVRRYPDGTPEKEDYQITSYFEIYHYVRQRAYLEEMVGNEDIRSSFTQAELAELEKKLASIKQRNAHDKNLLKLEFLPFAYNLARYKNLTTEALFDEDSESGKELVKRWKEREKGGNLRK